MSDQKQLKKSVGLLDMVTLGAGAAIGVSIFSIISPAVKLAGPAMLAAVVLAAIPMCIFALNYCFMSSTVPTSGASYYWPAHFVHPFMGFTVAWLRILGLTCGLIVQSMVLVGYLSPIAKIPVKPGQFVFFIIVFSLNLFGVKVAARAQTIMMILLLALFAVFDIVGIPVINTSNFVPFAPFGWGAVWAAIPILIGLYLGMETATEIGEEIKDNTSIMPKGIGIALLLTIVVYASVSLVVIGTAPMSELADSTTPLALSAANIFGSAANWIMVPAAFFAIGKTMNVMFMSFSRCLFSMSRDGILPSVLSKVHPKWGTPYVAIITALVILCLGLLLPQNLLFLFLALNVPTLLKYMGSCWAASRMPGHWPELYQRAKFKFSEKATVFFGYLGIVCAIVVIILGFSANQQAYVALGSWFVVGCIYYFIRVKILKKVPGQAELTNVQN